MTQEITRHLFSYESLREELRFIERCMGDGMIVKELNFTRGEDRGHVCWDISYIRELED